MNDPRDTHLGQGPGCAPTANAAARAYLARGLWPVPLAYKEKRPPKDLIGWPGLRITAETVNSYFPPDEPRNVGLILGVDGLVCGDLDCPEAEAAAPLLLPP